MKHSLVYSYQSGFSMPEINSLWKKTLFLFNKEIFAIMDNVLCPKDYQEMLPYQRVSFILHCNEPHIQGVSCRSSIKIMWKSLSTKEI